MLKPQKSEVGKSLEKVIIHEFNAPLPGRNGGTIVLRV